MGWVAPVVDTLSTIRHNRAMTSYVRPEIAPQVYRDANGTVIPYGEQWGLAGPPEESYSRETHPERFAPLHDVARALVAHLARTFEVDVERGVERASKLLYDHLPVVDAYRLRPRAADAAPLLVALTEYPGVIVQAGVFWSGLYPVCGCDACDEVWESYAEQLESHVLGVADGLFCETVVNRGREDAHMTYGYRIAGMGTGWSDVPVTSAEQRDEALARLDALPTGWQPWPRL